MRTLELRRRSLRGKPDQHLTQAGMTLACRAGETMGPLDRVITSTVPRAVKPALAICFALGLGWAPLPARPSLVGGQG